MKGMTQQLKNVTPELDNVILSKAIHILREAHFPEDRSRHRKEIRALLAQKLRFSRGEIQIILRELEAAGIVQQNCKGLKIYLGEGIEHES